ncbi:MAG: hypothetical protein BWY40_01097 [bacterium ADurb.Bin270]|nr:MAG: hypothetical protein BWY40_01097 [bacterium ADurb.Bin270]
MELIVLVIKQAKFLDEILTGFVDIGIRGATVVGGRGMGQVLSSDVPIFASLKDMLPGLDFDTHMVFSVADREQVEKAMALVKEVCGDCDEDGIGVLFTLPVGRFMPIKG